MYAGGSPSSSKVAEYDGNTNGFGSHSVLGKGWPKELVKVLTSIYTCVHVLIKMLYSDKSLAIFESSNISETGEVTPTKIGAHA